MAERYRQVARRVFAREFNAATHTFSDSDDEYAPVYALVPTGARVNRVFAVGTLTETENVGEENDYWRGRIVEPTGTFFAYAGEYQPEAMGALRRIEAPAHVAVIGKPRTYDTAEGETNVSLRTERLVEVGDAERHRWIVETAERTIERIIAFEEADEDEQDVALAIENYGEDLSPYREAVIRALEGLEAEEYLEASP